MFSFSKGKINKQAFEHIYSQYWEKVLGICYAQLQDREIAEELVQEIFKSIWERRDQLEISQHIEHYLITASKMKVIDYFRQRARQEQLMQHAISGLPLHERTTELQLQYNELNRELTKTVNALPEHCRIVYQYKREKGLSNKEIACMLDISVKTVEYHMKNALKILRQELAGYQLK